MASFSALKRRIERRKRAVVDERGFTLVEMIIAIPISFLILGLVLSSAGVAVALMGQVGSSTGAARYAAQTVDELALANSCLNLQGRMNGKTTPVATSDFVMVFDSHTCQTGNAFPVSFSVKDKNTAKIWYSKTVTLSVG